MAAYFRDTRWAKKQMDKLESCFDSGKESRSSPGISGLLYAPNQKERDTETVTLFFAMRARRGRQGCAGAETASVLVTHSPWTDQAPASASMCANHVCKNKSTYYVRESRKDSKRNNPNTQPQGRSPSVLCCPSPWAHALQFHHFWLKVGLQFSFLYGLK